MSSQISLNNATDIVALFETTKAERKSFVDSVLNEIDNGNGNALNIHLQVKCIEDVIKMLNENEKYKDFVLNECAKFGKNFEYKNAKIDIREVGVKYDYTFCNDPIINKLLLDKETLDIKVKERQKFLQSLPVKGVEVLFDDELKKIYPPSKSSSTSPVVKLL